LIQRLLRGVRDILKKRRAAVELSWERVPRMNVAVQVFVIV
jgi:hypothetical protein